MQRVGSRVQSGGSSVSSTSSVGVGKVRHMFQSRRGNSEARPGVAITGRDKSYPLEPIGKHVAPTRTKSLDADSPGNPRFAQPKHPWARRGASLDRSDDDRILEEYFEDYRNFENNNNNNRKIGVRRTQSQVRNDTRKSNVLYFGGSQNDLFSDELDYGQSFHVIDDHYEFDLNDKYDRQNDDRDEYFITSFNNKRQFYENQTGRVSEDNDPVINPGGFKKLPNVGLSTSFRMNQKTESNPPGKYKTYVTGNGNNININRTNMRNGAAQGKSGLPLRQVNGAKEVVVTKPPKQMNGSLKSPVRKATPMPAAVTPQQHLLQNGKKKITNSFKRDTNSEVRTF